MLKFDRKKTKKGKTVCFDFSNDGVAIAVGERKQDNFELLNSHFFSQTELDTSPSLIKDYISNHKLAKLNCSIVLPASDYKMLLTEAPNVNESEMREALWWKIKDLVSVDYENAQIDYIELPEDIIQQHGKKVYAIAADKEKTNEKISFVQKLGLTPNVVETQESALLHLTHQLCKGIIGTSTLYLNNEQSSLMLISEEKLYISRTLQYNYLTRMDAVTLDLQRSMDYYESQLGKSPCLKIIVLPLQDSNNDIMQTLVNNINATIETVDLNNIMTSADEISADTQQLCLVAIAGALRSDKKASK